jgi:hypothetical protein
MFQRSLFPNCDSRQGQQKYDILGDLFDQLSVSLSQFRICQRIKQYPNIDITSPLMSFWLASPTFVVFPSVFFMGIPGESREPRQEQLFLGDDIGVGAELANFQSLVSKRITVADTLTLESVRRNKRKLSQAARHLENLRPRAGRNPNRIGQDQKGH